MPRYCLKGQELLALVPTAVMQLKGQADELEWILTGADALLRFNEHVMTCVSCADIRFGFPESVPPTIQ
jgi:hypothetical protein